MTMADYLIQTRASYNTIAVDYDKQFVAELDGRPVERAVLGLFADLVRDAGPVLDAGCGTGRIADYLAGLGVAVRGLDLSPGMLALARTSFPELLFVEGSLLALPDADASLAGLLAWYSTIHLSDQDLPVAFSQFFRVLQPGGQLLLGFQVGNHLTHRDELFGLPVNLGYHRRDPARVGELLIAAGFESHSTVLREPLPGEGIEPTRKAYLLVRKPAVDRQELSFTARRITGRQR